MRENGVVCFSGSAVVDAEVVVSETVVVSVINVVSTFEFLVVSSVST